MTRVSNKMGVTGAFFVVVLASCGSGDAVTTSSSSPRSSVASSTTIAVTTPTTSGTTDNGGTSASQSTTSTAETTTTLADGPFGSGVSTAGVIAQLSYSLATPQEICTGFEDEPGVNPLIGFQSGASVSVGDVVFICLSGFDGFEEVTITPPGAGGVVAFMDQRDGSPYVAWTVLPGDALGSYSVSATPGEEGDALEATFTVGEATTPGLRVVEPAEERWLQPEWPGRDEVSGEIFLAFFGMQSQGTVTIDIYADPEINEVEAGYVGSLQITPESGGAGILTLPSANEEGFFCFSIRSQAQSCDAAVQLFQ